MKSDSLHLWQIEVFPKSEAVDPAGRSALFTLREFGVKSVRQIRSTQLFIIQAAADRATIEQAARDLLADPVTEDWSIVSPTDKSARRNGVGVIEVHPRPGVMDPVAASAKAALGELGVAVASIRTARRYAMNPAPGAAEMALIRRLLGNECIHEVVDGLRPPAPPPKPVQHEFRIRHIGLRALKDDDLTALSRAGHLILSLSEMQAVRSHFQQLGRDPTDLELETIAQTWSEHCVHKTLKSAIVYRGAAFPWLASETGGAGSSERPRTDPGVGDHVERFDNLLRDTIARATRDLMAAGRGPQCLSVFKDNAGVIAFDDRYGIAFKVETHNRPSAIEPYGGAATGIGGCIRDVLGCGLGAKPIANTDVFCVAPPDWPVEWLPRGVIHPRTVLRGVVAGVRDYGNRMGIPTVNGAVHFDPRYLGNPLVFCGCVGLIPRERVEKAARPDDLIVLLGGRTGRDGIHGATFSSAELTSTHADEFSHAVQIGNAIEEKKVLDVVLQARDHPDGCLYHAITDCGAGGLSSAVGEMAAESGAEVDLETVPLKYEGLRYDEIWISESQERMVLAVPAEQVAALKEICRIEDVEATVIGRFTQSGRLVVRYRGQVVGDLDLRFLHDGLPKEEREAEWRAPAAAESEMPHAEQACGGHEPDAIASPVSTLATPFDPQRSPLAGPDANQPAPVEADAGRGATGREPLGPPLQTGAAVLERDAHDLAEELCRRLSLPTIASKEWIIRQYDHEVQGRSVIKPLVGARRDGPGDAAVLRPLLDSPRGVAIGCGLCPQLSDIDPYWMAVAAIDEALRNVVCVGGDPLRTAILDNFCWGRTDDPRQLGGLVRACVGCRDAAMIYGTPFISGKDSLNNEFALHADDVAMLNELAGAIREGRLAIPGTLLISAVSLIDDVSRCVTMDLKPMASRLYLLGRLTRIESPGRSAADGAQPPLAVRSSKAVNMLDARNETPSGRLLLHDGPSPAEAQSSFDPRIAARTHHLAARLIFEGRVAAAHDVSDGGLLVALAEMALAGDMSCTLLGCPGGPAGAGGLTPFGAANAFAECPGCYVVQIPEPVPIEHLLRDDERDLPIALIGRAMSPGPDDAAHFSFPAAEPEFGVADERIAVARLREAWQATLRW